MKVELIERRTLHLNLVKWPDAAIDLLEDKLRLEGWAFVGWAWHGKKEETRVVIFEKPTERFQYRRVPKRWRVNT